MPNLRTSISQLLVVAALVGSASSALAEDWSQFRGPTRDGQANMLKVPANWPDSLQQRWQVKVGSGHASPVVSGDRVYLMARQGDDEVAMALDLATGKTLWSKSFATPYMPHQAAVKHGQGPKSTPIIADDTVCFLGIDARFSCHDADSGEQLWQRDFSDKSSPEKTFCGSSMSPLVADGVIYVHLGDDIAGRFFAAELRTGKELWGWEGQGPGYASPQMLEIDGQRQVVTFATTDLLSFDPANGKLLWQRNYLDKWRENIVMPLVVGERILISDYVNGTLALWPKKTAEGWTVEDHWHNKELTQRMASPVTNGKVVFGFSDKRKGQLFALDPATGKVLWQGEGRGGSNAVLALADDWLLVANTDAELRILTWRDGAMTEVQRYEIASSPVWAEPAWLADGLLVKDVDHLTRLAIPVAPAPAAATTP